MDRLTTTVSTKGQVILPKPIRQALRWEAGTELVVENTGRRGLAQGEVAASPPTKACAGLRDVCAIAASRKTIEEMDAAVAAEARRRHARD